MFLTPPKFPKNTQKGASLIEVLIAILILSFGLLAMGGMLSLGVLMPKLSGYRSTATNLASSHVDAIRANPFGFQADQYNAALNENSNWSSTAIALSGSNCSFTGTKCTSTTLAAADTNIFRNAVRRDLPAGDIVVRCSTSPCTSASYGELWVIWKEPASALDISGSDQCPATAIALYTNPKPRCLYVRFQIQ